MKYFLVVLLSFCFLLFKLTFGQEITQLWQTELSGTENYLRAVDLTAISDQIFLLAEDHQAETGADFYLNAVNSATGQSLWKTTFSTTVADAVYPQMTTDLPLGLLMKDNELFIYGNGEGEAHKNTAVVLLVDVNNEELNLVAQANFYLNSLVSTANYFILSGFDHAKWGKRQAYSRALTFNFDQLWETVSQAENQFLHNEIYSATVVQDTLYEVGYICHADNRSYDALINKRSLNTGKLIWSRSIDFNNQRDFVTRVRACLNGDLIIWVVSEGNNYLIYLNSSTGKQRWIRKFDSGPNAHFLINNGYVYFLVTRGYQDSYIYLEKIDLISGKKVLSWAFNSSGKDTSKQLSLGQDGNIYVLASTDSKISRLFYLDSTLNRLADYKTSGDAVGFKADNEFIYLFSNIYFGYNNIYSKVKLTKLSIDNISNVDNPIRNIILDFQLCQNYPNPFNPVTTIKYKLPQSAQAELIVYNISGQKVATLVKEKQSAGEYQVRFNASHLPSGTYIYQLRAGKFIQTKKMVLLK